MFIAEFSIRLKDTGEEEINKKYTHFAATTGFNERQNKTCRLNDCNIIIFFNCHAHSNKIVVTILQDVCRLLGFSKLA